MKKFMKGLTFKNGVYVFDYRDEDGKRIRIKFDKKGEAEAKAHEVREKLRQIKLYGKAKTVKEIKFEDFADEFFKDYCMENNKSKATYYNLQHLRKFFSGLNLSQITPQKIEQFKAKMKQTVYTFRNAPSRKIQESTINRALECLSTLFNVAKTWGKFIGDNPVDSVSHYPKPNRKVNFLEVDEINKLLEHCDKPRRMKTQGQYLMQIAAIAVNTGLRPGNIMALKWSDLDFRRRILHVYKGKTKKKLEIAMNENVINALISVRKHPTSDLVFVKEDGKPYGAFKKSFFTALKKAGINRPFRFYDLRHTNASQLAMHGATQKSIMDLLGHTDMRTTDIYTHLSPQYNNGVVSILDKIIKLPAKNGHFLDKVIDVPNSKVAADSPNTIASK